MTDLGELSIKLSEACNDLEKLMAVDNEIRNNYFGMSDEAATPGMLKCYYSQYRALHDVLIDYLVGVQNKVDEARENAIELWQAEAGRKPGEPVKQR